MALFSLPALPASPTIVTTTIELTSLSGPIPAGTTYFAEGLPWLIRDYGFNGLLSFVNAGTLWGKNLPGAVGQFQNLDTIANSGLIVAEATTGTAAAIRVSSNISSLTNSGEIYAVALNGNASAIEEWGGNRIDNSGTIGASGSNYATAITAANGGVLNNLAGGEILAEGAKATAYWGTNATIVNDGMIVARSTVLANPSVAIYLAGAGSLTNRGIVAADFAFFATDYWYTPTQHQSHTITNEIGGQIGGSIWTGLGDDVLINRGEIHGFVLMGGDDDLVDNAAGWINGASDLGFGDDDYLGGQAGDFVFGDRGDDELRGGSGNDLLVGGRGSDSLFGDGGADGLHGDVGDDRIVTLGGDEAVGGAGDDRIELGDYAFSSAAGSDGWDTLVLPSGARTIDLQAAIATGRLSGIEAIELGGGKGLTVRPGDPAALSDEGQLWIQGTQSDSITLVGAWIGQGTGQRDGTTYQIYALGNEKVWVGGQASVTVAASAAPGSSGLDPVVEVQAPPLGSWGISTSESAFSTSRYQLESPMVIDPDEHWTSSDNYVLITAGGNSQRTTLDNYGTLSASRVAISGQMVHFDNYGTVEVTALTGTSQLAGFKTSLATYGAIRLENIGAAVALVIDLGGSTTYIANHNQISVETDELGAIGLSSYMLDNFINSGSLTATSHNFAAIGVSAHNGGRIENSGTISATGALLANAVLLSTFPGTIINSGTISAAVTGAGGEAVAIQGYWQHSTNRIENSGLIEGAVAIRTSTNVNGGATEVINTGQIVGAIEFHANSTGGIPTNDTVMNGGSISGQVRLGGGNDLYDGTGGTQTGTVFGDAGLDRLIGTAGADTLDGGADDDVLFGAGGDTLTGGGGGDTFVFTTVGPGIERITDFVSGTDRINLGQVSPTSVTIEGNQVVVVTAQGTLRIEVSGGVAMSDILVAAASLTGTAGSDALVAAGAAGTTLTGLGGNDLLLGQQGNDRLDGGEGADWLSGGPGDDTYVLGANDVVIERGGEGYDTVEVSPGTVAWQMPDHVERLIGGNGRGNALDNEMVGSSLGDNLDGGIGADRLVGGLGNDFYTVDNAGDAVIEALGEGTDTVASYIDYTLPEHVENLQVAAAVGAAGIGNAAANIMNGSSGSDKLHGEAGNDFLNGGFGADWLYGGDGEDILTGWDGLDTLYGGNGDDLLYANNAPAVGGDPYAGAGVPFTPVDDFNDQLFGGAGNDQLYGNRGSNVLDGGAGHDFLDGMDGVDTLIGGAGNDTLEGGVNVDTAVLAGNRAAYSWTQVATGTYSLVGPDGTDTLRNVEYLKFDDQIVRLRPGSGTDVNFNAAPSTFMAAIRDFGGNDLGGTSGWKLIGAADVNGDGDVDQILVNKDIGRFAEIGIAPDGLVYFGDHGWAGETRVVGIYVDPLVQSGQVTRGGPFDSQRRFQTDLQIDNIKKVLGAGDYDRDGLQEVYFGLTDGTAYLHAYMHADGNIRYANYQSQQQVIDFLGANGWAASTYDGWFA